MDEAVRAGLLVNYSLPGTGETTIVMEEVAEFRRYAEICRKLSLDASDKETKRQLAEMRTVWTLLAEERALNPDMSL